MTGWGAVEWGGVALRVVRPSLDRGWRCAPRSQARRRPRAVKRWRRQRCGVTRPLVDSPRTSSGRTAPAARRRRRRSAARPPLPRGEPALSTGPGPGGHPRPDPTGCAGRYRVAAASGRDGPAQRDDPGRQLARSRAPGRCPRRSSGRRPGRRRRRRGPVRPDPVRAVAPIRAGMGQLFHGPSGEASGPSTAAMCGRARRSTRWPRSGRDRSRAGGRRRSPRWRCPRAAGRTRRSPAPCPARTTPKLSSQGADAADVLAAGLPVAEIAGWAETEGFPKLVPAERPFSCVPERVCNYYRWGQRS